MIHTKDKEKAIIDKRLKDLNDRYGYMYNYSYKPGIGHIAFRLIPNKSVYEFDDDDFKKIEQFLENREKHNKNSAIIKETAKEMNITYDQIYKIIHNQLRKKIIDLTTEDMKYIKDYIKYKYMKNTDSKYCKRTRLPIKFDISPYKSVSRFYKEEFLDFMSLPTFTKIYKKINTKEEFNEEMNKYIENNKKIKEVNAKLEELCKKYNIRDIKTIKLLYADIRNSKPRKASDLFKDPRMLSILENYLKYVYKQNKKCDTKERLGKSLKEISNESNIPYSTIQKYYNVSNSIEEFYEKIKNHKQNKKKRM